MEQIKSGFPRKHSIKHYKQASYYLEPKDIYVPWFTLTQETKSDFEKVYTKTLPKDSLKIL